jgi:hypothetical protein
MQNTTPSPAMTSVKARFSLVASSPISLPELDAVLGQPQLIGQAPPAKEVATTAMPKSEAPGILVVLVKIDLRKNFSCQIRFNFSVTQKNQDINYKCVIKIIQLKFVKHFCDYHVN